VLCVTRMRRFTHGGQSYALADEWWAEADMGSFLPTTRCYKADETAVPGRQVTTIPVSDVEPLVRDGTHGVFNDSPHWGSARERVTKILNGFRAGTPLPPVKLVRTGGRGLYQYRLYDGAHRFYCSVAAGFSAVPAIVYAEGDVDLDE
jgi:hypothetical protein